MLPGSGPGALEEQTWAPVLAWILLRSIPAQGIRALLFDSLQLRAALAEAFSSMGMESGKTWRLAAQVRVLLMLEDAAPLTIYQESFWEDPDVRWLTGVNISAGITYFNKEQFEEFLCWIQLPALIALAGKDGTDLEPLQKLELSVVEACDAAREAGYQLEQFLGSPQEKQTTPNSR
jgi:hypothetical protein